MSDAMNRYSQALMGTYGQPQRVLVRGEGCYVWDDEGNRYLDLLAGIAVNALGHANPALVQAVSSQLTTLGHTSNFFTTEPSVKLAEEVLRISGAPAGSKVFFCNSGAEAVEAAIKVTRRTGRRRIVALEGAFHGRTLGALALTHKPAYREPFEPLTPGVTHVPFGDVEALAAAVDDTVAAVFLEPIQGEGGVRPLPPGYLGAARRITRDAGALLVLDEIQTGIGRVGTWLAHQRPELGSENPDDVTPDLVTLAKGLGGGLPIGAMVAFGERVAGLLGAGQHGTTFGGNPVSSAAGLATIGEIDRTGMLEHVRDLGDQWAADLAAVDHPLVGSVRGLGLLLAIELTQPVAAHVAKAALDAGFIVNAVATDAVRLAPPLVLSKEQADSFTQALRGLLDTATKAAEEM
ncbi:MAG TPA: acetylornithine transaminase [Actinomycetales bacterium]|nr:acetylornithine transaminase [Actinomycetales bacterium]